MLFLPLWSSIRFMLPQLQIGMDVMARYHHPLQKIYNIIKLDDAR